MNSAGANALACDATDPFSKQPELKHCAVQITRIELPYPLAVIRRCANQEEALQLLQAAKVLLADFPYATLALYGRRSPLVIFRSASMQAISSEKLQKVDQFFGLLGDEGAILFADASRQISKKAIVSDGRLQAVRLAGEALAQVWLKQAMAEDELDSTLVRFALAPLAKAPSSVAPRQIICKCADVSDEQIRHAMLTGDDLPRLQDKLKCGTFCGSCVPEIKRMLLEVKEIAPA